jgi:hydrogenase-4 component B
VNIGFLLLVSGLCLLLGIVSGRSDPRIWLASNLLGTGAAFIAAVWVLLGGQEWDWQSDQMLSGEQIHLRLDGLSALFLALLGVVGGMITVYSREYWSDGEHPSSARAGRVWWSVLLASIGIVFLSSNGLHFLIAWEIFTVASYFLITLDRQRSEVRAAGWLYLGASHAATLCLFAFFSILSVQTGSWDLGPMRGHSELAPLFWLLLVAFGLKAGMFPLHIWLPSAHANAPSHISAMMSGVTIKMGIYGLLRFSGWLPVPAAAGWVVTALGLASAVLGVAFALGQHDIKRLLAYHSVENIGIILIGLGFALIAVRHGHAAWGQIALIGALLHVWNHGLFKSLLFLGAGSVLHSTRTREMSRLGGLWRRLPWTAALFALGAVAISGLPPLNGFVSEWLIYIGLFGAVNFRGNPALAGACAVTLLAITGALALACFAKVCGVVFLGAPRTDSASHAHECGPLMRAPMAALAALCVAIGLAPTLFWPAVARAALVWNPAWKELGLPPSLGALGKFNMTFAAASVFGASLLWIWSKRTVVRRALTWDCGYAAPTARMQYTAGSFAAIIVDWFGWILRPQKHDLRPVGSFPATAAMEEHTPETVLEFIVEPAGEAVTHLSNAARRLQHGKLQAYLLYLVVGILVLGFIVAFGGGP